MRVTAAAIISLIILLFSFRPAETGTDHKISRIFAQMYDSIRNIHTLQQNILAVERIDKQFSINRSQIKVQSNPRKVYFINPGKKLEILYDSEAFQNKAWVKPHIFPYMTMMLDPHGNIMRKNQHYTINELGYEFIGKSIALTIKKDKEGLANFTFKGKAMKNGYNCYAIEYENNNYSYVDYVVGSRESATMISLNLCVNDYLLRDRNHLLNDFGYLKKGTILKVPNLYCKKAVLFIDEHLMLPVALSLFDDKGLFESYEYTDVRINKGFNSREFSKDFPGYNF